VSRSGPARRPGIRLWVACLAVLGFLVLVLGGCGTGGSAPGATTGPADPPTDASGRKAAPELTGATLDGLELSNETFKGQPLILAFWGSW
jgi:hypothetical protein